MEGDDSVTPNHLDSGNMQYGCKHYRRRCKIRAPCCNLVFTCRHCHNEAAGSMHLHPDDRHELVRRDVKKVICSVCDTEQEVARVCSKCGITFAEYYCEVCKFYDDDVTKKQFHCEECGICRVGGRENFFHCRECGFCYAIDLRDNHSCVHSMKNSCLICLEDLFDSLKSTKKLKCGHTIHMDCWFEMCKHDEYRCPTCSKSMYNMSSRWKLLKEEIEHTPMPQGLQYEILILCHDCNNTSKVLHHISGHECLHCNHTIHGGLNQTLISDFIGPNIVH